MTREYWANIVRGSITVNRIDPEITERIIDLCYSSDQAGQPVGSWHAASVVMGTKCHCAKCNPQTKRFC
jgi:hypothetical protein